MTDQIETIGYVAIGTDSKGKIVFCELSENEIDQYNDGSNVCILSIKNYMTIAHRILIHSAQILESIARNISE